MINPASALKKAAGLMKVERHAVFNALHLGDNDPAIVAESGSLPGFSAAGDTFDLVVVLLQILFNMDFLQHRFVDDFLVAYRKIQKDGETPVRLVLVLTGAADVDVLISIVPVHGDNEVGKTDANYFRPIAFREENTSMLPISWNCGREKKS